jgi:hypothetical protein
VLSCLFLKFQTAKKIAQLFLPQKLFSFVA